jgi:DNA-binding response OmpR family regulator
MDKRVDWYGESPAVGGDARVERETRVLIVEDEFLIALQIESILTAAGYRVVGIMSDRAALPAVIETPDVALVDLNLRDGPTGCEIAGELARRYGTRIVYVTANPAQIAEPAPTAIGIVHKPFSQDAIEAAVCQAIVGRQFDGGSPAALPVFGGPAFNGPACGATA